MSANLFEPEKEICVPEPPKFDWIDLVALYALKLTLLAIFLYRLLPTFEAAHPMDSIGE